MTRSTGEYGRERERELRSITQDGTTAGVFRERNKEEERKEGNGEKVRKRERRQPRR